MEAGKKYGCVLLHCMLVVRRCSSSPQLTICSPRYAPRGNVPFIISFETFIWSLLGISPLDSWHSRWKTSLIHWEAFNQWSSSLCSISECSAMSGFLHNKWAVFLDFPNGFGDLLSFGRGLGFLKCSLSFFVNECSKSLLLNTSEILSGKLFCSWSWMLISPLTSSASISRPSWTVFTTTLGFTKMMQNLIRNVLPVSQTRLKLVVLTQDEH